MEGFFVEIGVTTFVETTPDVETGKVISHAERIREVVEEIVLADSVGLRCVWCRRTSSIRILQPLLLRLCLPQLHHKQNKSD